MTLKLGYHELINRRLFAFLILIAAFNCVVNIGWADIISFQTESSAVQTITSPLFGGAVDISAVGAQTFTLDTNTGVADVVSLFLGSDFPDPLNPGGFLDFDLYNTTTMGSFVQNMNGFYDVQFSVLFELQITSGLLNGLTFETQDFADFVATDVASLPFPPGTAFLSPDPVTIFVQFDPTGTFNPGDPVGQSSNRTVTILNVVPEPTSGLIFAVGLGLIAIVNRRR